MNDAGESVDWRHLREFKGVDLSKSFVLSWRMDKDTLLVEVDVLLQPEHPFYEKPRPAEKVCIRPACIEFRHCDSVNPAANTLAHGAIEGLSVRDGIYTMMGEFGTVTIDGERPLLRLESP